MEEKSVLTLRLKQEHMSEWEYFKTITPRTTTLNNAIINLIKEHNEKHRQKQ